MIKFIKQGHGHTNKIFLQEEVGIIASIDKVTQSSGNPQILGRNGEKCLVGFLNKYLPNCFRAISGHFVTPSGVLSPEIDVMIIDARYPYLSQNEDGTIVAMLHSVIATIEVKLSVTKGEIKKIRKNSIITTKLTSEVFPSPVSMNSLVQYGFAYKTKLNLKTLAKHFFMNYKKLDPLIDLYVLRLKESDQTGDEGPLGASLWLETSRFPAISTSLAPLSDFYYSLLQNSYYTLDERNITFGDLGKHMSKYMSWGTFPCFNRDK